MSGSQPDSNNDMMARSPRKSLDTREKRKRFLKIHVNHRSWKDTPFVSFTSCHRELQKVANLRYKRPGRGSQTITVVDPRVRMRCSLPLLNIESEMEFYGVENPYANVDHSDHYLCLWEVRDSEIVGHWDWEDLKDNPNWHEDTIMPAVQQFRERAQMEHSAEAFDMSGLLDSIDSEHFQLL